MRNTFFILLLLSLRFSACQPNGDSEQDQKVVDAFDYEKAGIITTEEEEKTTEMEDDLHLTDLPKQKPAPNTVNFAGEYKLPEEHEIIFSVSLEQKGDSIIGT